MAYAFTINEPQVSRVFRCIPGAESYFSGQDALCARSTPTRPRCSDPSSS